MSQVPSSGGSLSDLLGGGSLSAGIGDIGSAVGDLFSQMGDKAEAGEYRLASDYALQEARFTESSTHIKEMQAQRQIQQAVGGVRSGYAGAGLMMAGSAGDVLRESSQQGALTTAAIQYQGAETELGFKEQAQSYSMMADAADKAASGAGIAGIVQGIGAAVNIGSKLLPLLAL